DVLRRLGDHGNRWHDDVVSFRCDNGERAEADRWEVGSYQTEPFLISKNTRRDHTIVRGQTCRRDESKPRRAGRVLRSDLSAAPARRRVQRTTRSCPARSLLPNGWRTVKSG